MPQSEKQIRARQREVKLVAIEARRILTTLGRSEFAGLVTDVRAAVAAAEAIVARAEKRAAIGGGRCAECGMTNQHSWQCSAALTDSGRRDKREMRSRRLRV